MTSLSRESTIASEKNAAETVVDIKTESPRKANENEEANQHTYPHLLESAPFPSLGAIEEISRVLSRNTIESTKQRAQGDEEKKEVDIPIWDVELDEGWRNPGWMVVVASFLVNFFVFGNTFSWGNFQKLYLEEVYKGQTDQFKIAFVGSSGNSCLLSLGLFMTPVIQRLGYRGTMVIGTILSPLGIILASFATELWHVYLSQGILFGVGAAFVYSPSITLPSQWFKKHRAVATGIAVSGSGIGGVALSPMIQHLIPAIGYRNTLRVIGAMGFGILCIATALARSRYRPPPSSSSSSSWGFSAFYDKSMLTWQFGLLIIFSVLVPFGYIGPFFLCPTYASFIGVSAAKGSALISVMSGMNSVCRISLGFLADYTGRVNTMFGCTLLAGIFTMVIWQFSSSYGVYVTYCVLYGLTGGGFVSLFPVVAADVVGVQQIQRALGICYFMTMFGNLIGAPIIGLLQTNYGWTAAIQFGGSTTVAAAIVMLGLRFLRTRKLLAKV